MVTTSSFGRMPTRTTREAGARVCPSQEYSFVSLSSELEAKSGATPISPALLQLHALWRIKENCKYSLLHFVILPQGCRSRRRPIKTHCEVHS